MPTKKFGRVLVKDFTYQVEDAEDDHGRTPAATRQFADLIVLDIKEEKAGAIVSRTGKADADTLVIEGEVTRFEEGNAALRLFVGMGAGRSHFDAMVRFVDGGTGKVLGEIEVSKNSWVLGGIIASAQDAGDFLSHGTERASEEAALWLR